MASEWGGDSAMGVSALSSSEPPLLRSRLNGYTRTSTGSNAREFLAMKLGVRRPGVTVAIQQLEREGVIAKKRGRIAITNNKALEKRSNGSYLPADYL
jgi:hypothetical protein